MDAVSYELLLYGLLVGLAGGAIAAMLAGLVGIGGGLIYVPLFYVAMPGEQADLSLHVMASLVAIAMTGFYSARAHWRLGHVHKQSLILLYPGLMIGAAIGLWSTLTIPAVWILLSLAMLNAWIAWDYGRELKSHHNMPLATVSGIIGYISGALGIGGGTMLVPLLRRIVSLRQAVGTSAACGMLLAVAAVIINLLFESRWMELISGQLYFLTGAWTGMLLIVPKASSMAAYLHSRVEEATMRLMLKILFCTLSAGFILAALAAVSP